MKSIDTVILSLAAALMLSACGDVIEIPDVSYSGNGQDIPGPEENPLSGDVVFTATAENLPDGKAFTWKKGCEVTLYDGISARTLANEAGNGVLARFPATLTGEEKGFLAVSPASEDVQFSPGKITFQMPAVRSAAAEAAAYMAAKASGKSLYFKHLTATVVLPVGLDGITKIRLQSAGGEKIAGEVTVNLAGNAPVVTATEDYIELTGEFVKGRSYSISILPGKLSGYSITAYQGTTEAAHVSGGETTLAAASTTTLDSVGQDIPTFRITNLWVYGGTGPEYGGDNVIDILTKPTYFTDKDGRGINAIKDNYFELRPDGTFMNWAGADGRNWWYVYSGKVNPATGKDLDLKDFYEVMPRGRGSWSVSGTSITFTFPDGKTSTGSLVMPGTTTIRGDRAVTIAAGHFALKFTVTGGKDDWNHAFTDYDVIAAHPRQYFVEFEQMPDGFKTPAASCTTDTDFKYEAPEEPVVEFDWDSFAGEWIVLGDNDNKEPFGFTVLGGSGNDPAFLSPLEKSWNFNASVKNESDNTLTITVSETSATEIKGTTTWEAGADGAFWDYQWIKTTPPTDLSRFYDKIPKGAGAFTLNLSTLEITLGNGEKAKVLTPGTHTFKGTSSISFAKNLEVPNGCFALDFHLMDPIPATSARWTDVDRYINAPLEYVIIFEK